jgi:hypothetical protein
MAHTAENIALYQLDRRITAAPLRGIALRAHELPRGIIYTHYRRQIARHSPPDNNFFVLHLLSKALTG